MTAWARWGLLAFAFWLAAVVLLIHEDGMWLAALLLGVIAGIQAIEEEKP